MVTPKTKQWFGAEIPWANYERYIGYVKAHKDEKLTVGNLIVVAVDAYLKRQPKQPEAPPKAGKSEASKPKNQKVVSLVEAKATADRLAPAKTPTVTKLAPGEGT